MNWEKSAEKKDAGSPHSKGKKLDEKNREIEIKQKVYLNMRACGDDNTIEIIQEHTTMILEDNSFCLRFKVGQQL